MAAAAAEVGSIEIDAQHAIHGYSGRTYAAGGDIHARPVPEGNRGAEYRPEAVGPEMPTLLAGSRNDRVEQAKAYAARSHAVADKTRNLIALEAENAFFQWREASAQAVQYRKARDLAKENAETREKEAKEDKVTRSEAIRASEINTQMRVEANEALYRLLLALASLERVTAGAVCPDFVPPAPAHP
jgi:outer membrane protein TolC